MLTFEITLHDHCRRLESFLRTLLPTAQSGYPRKLIKSGAARLNGTAATPDTLLTIHDSVTLKESATLTALLSDTRPRLDILYEDGHIVIVNKPAGLPMHRTAELEHDLVEQGMNYMTWRGTPCKLYPVNRLDRGTSGTVILAKSSSSAGIYGRQVKESGLEKLYLALVDGIPAGGGIINEPLDNKESETRYDVLLSGEGCTLLAVTPVSGRMHQIRRHLEMIGHPVLGDRRYGNGELAGLVGFALHSFRTVLVRPDAGAVAVCAPLPEELLALCQRCGIGQEEILARVGRLAVSLTTEGPS
ncbi:MAG: RluA family pseudouridine synthase [Deltaproteobacteria bacterium]|nr:RluA family pseudouridine synthase [Deltaproteobacteria bacterium]